MQTSYRPELDVSPELQPTDAAYYMSLIGVLRWIVELGRVDVCLECSMLSSHLALPREGHLYQLFQCFACLKKYHNTEMVYDTSDPVMDESVFESKDWTSSEFGHLQGKKELPTNMPEPRGQGFVISAKVDADHASDTVTRRSRTGFFVYLNCAPVYWLSKKLFNSFSESYRLLRLCLHSREKTEIAILRHLSTPSRRRRCIEELVRIVRPGGTINIQAWAIEQEEGS
jgi:hypothetical protein